MNRKQFIALVVLVVVIGAAGWLVRQRSKESWQAAGQGIGQKLLPNLPVNDIAQITIKSGGNELNLAKRDGLWRVRERGDYPADFSQISELLLKFADLKVVQTEEIGASQLGRFELLPPAAGANTATSVELKDAAGRPLGALLLGKRHMRQAPANSPYGGEGWPDGRYVKAGEAKAVALISDLLDNVQPSAAGWLNKEFLRIEKPRSIAVQFAEATNSWKLTRASETDDWQIADAKAAEKLDAAKVSGVTSPFSSATFNDVAALTASNKPVGTTLNVETFDGFSYVGKIGASENGAYPVHFTVSANFAAERVAGKDEKAEDKARLDQEFKDRRAKLAEKLAREQHFANWIYQVPTYTVDPLLKPSRDLLAEVKADTEAKPEK
jgi:hypothetical protein